MSRARNIILISLALIMISGPLLLSGSRRSTFSDSENRMLARFPETPTTLGQLSAFPGRVDAFLRDNLGLREWMTWAYATIRVRLLQSGNDNVLLGRDDWLFYRGEDNLEKSAGLYRRTEQITRTIAILAAMQDDLAGQGARLIVAVPPNNATIEDAALPAWARNHGRATEYDLLLEALRSTSIPAFDLRPALRAAARQASVYHRHDTHWTPRGAVIAVNTILDGSHAGWQVDPAAVLGPPALKIGGDEAKMLGLEDEFREEVEPLLPPHRPIAEPADQLPYREAGGRDDGKRILIIGDSFTYSFFAPLLRPGTKEVMWLAHQTCHFDWSIVRGFHPDEVWWMPTERLIACSPQTQPLHLIPEEVTASPARQ